MKPFHARVIAAAACLLALSHAEAATVSFEAGLPLSESPTEISRSYSLGLFNSSLGTLTGISLDLFGSASFSATVFNPSVSAVIVQLTISSEIAWSSSIPALAALLAPLPLELSFSSGPFALGSGSSQSFGPVARSASVAPDAAALLALGGSLSAPGGGSFNLDCRSLTGLVVQGGGGAVSAPSNTTAACGARLTYIYEPAGGGSVVSLPGTLSLAGLGLAGLWLGASRRRVAPQAPAAPEISRLP